MNTTTRDTRLFSTKSLLEIIFFNSFIEIPFYSRQLRIDHYISLVCQIYTMEKNSVENLLPMKPYTLWSFPL